MSQQHKSQVRTLYTTQSLVETLNSNEILLEIQQQLLKKKKKRKILILVKEDKNEHLFTLLLPLYTMEI